MEAMASQPIPPPSSYPATFYFDSIPSSPSLNKYLPTRALTGIRRRPDSIFSRRGTDSPVQTVAPVPMRLQNPSSNSPPRAQTKRWKIRRAHQDQSGTVLRAVPRSRTPPSTATASFAPSPTRSGSVPDPITHAAVEAEMAISPNEEILSKVGSILAPLPPPPYQPHCSLPAGFNFPMVSPTTSPKNHKKGRKSEGDAASIGIWKNGKAHWDSEPTIPLVQRPSDAFVAELDSRFIKLETPVRETASLQKDQRPRIQVIIPNDPRIRAARARVPPSMAPPVQPVPITEMMSSRDVSPPSVSSSVQMHNSAVSPLANQAVRQHRRQGSKNTTVPIYLEQVPESPHRAAPAIHKSWPSVSSSSNISNTDNDDSSNYSRSNRSSMTSIDSEEAGACLRPNPTFFNLDGRTASKAFSIVSPADAGIFDESVPFVTASQPASPVASNGPITGRNLPELNKPLPAEPIGLQVPSVRTTVFTQLRTRASTSSLLSSNGSSLSRRNSRRNPRMSPPPRSLARVQSRMLLHVDPPSPTLSEAETALEEQLSVLGNLSPHEWEDVPSMEREPSLRVPSRVPSIALPRKSSRRKRAMLPVGTSSGHVAAQQHDGTKRALSEMQPQSERQISPEAAQNVIDGIFGRLNSLDDMFSLATVNKGFYRVFKRHELRFMRTVLKNQSPAAWEHRETCPPYTGNETSPASELPQPEYSPTTFYLHHMRDSHVISALKSLVLTRCQSFLRSETVVALSSENAARSARMDDAFWRIWTFCKIFGCGKGREDDIVGQMDWLRGGPLVHQAGCRATIMSSDSIDASGALLNAGEHFGMGNAGGLSAEELYDMTEIWTCMGVLISGLEARTEQAREYGVYEATDVRGGDIDGEEKMLQEWIYYLSTLGLSTIFDLATPSTAPDASAFILASGNGWMEWSPPQHGGSRRTFLKEAVARVYEEKIAAMASTTPDRKQEMKRVMRQRIAAHKAEIQLRRRNGDFPLVRMSMERPMSEWECVLGGLGADQQQQRVSFAAASASAPSPLVPEPPAMDDMQQRRSSQPPPPLCAYARTQGFDAPVDVHPAFRQSTASSSRLSTAQVHPALRSSRASSANYSPNSSISSIDAPPASWLCDPSRRPSSSWDANNDGHHDAHPTHRRRVSSQHPRQQEIMAPHRADNTSERAIFRLVEMGFTADEAKHALKKTDMGDGLRVDRAVELLLRNM